MSIFRTERTKEEVENLYQKIYDHSVAGASKYPGMSYEQGFMAAIDYLEGQAKAEEVWEE